MLHYTSVIRNTNKSGVVENDGNIFVSEKDVNILVFQCDLVTTGQLFVI